MRRSDEHLSETDIRSRRAKTWAVRANKRDRREWLTDAPVCRILRHYYIMHLGIARMPSPFEIVRTKLGGSYFLACFGGEGRVVVDGRLKRCRRGQAFLLPPGTRHAFQGVKSKEWHFCWVRFQEQPGQQPIATANSPVLADYDPQPLRLAIEGLYHECSHDGVPAEMENWMNLIQSYVQRFAEPRRLDERIWKLWEEVADSLSHPWTSGEMAAKVHVSEKQLERLCRQELGRTPRQQLIWLRMRRASELLAEDTHKISSIAAEVGYENPFVFSTTFKRCMGWPPSEHLSRVAAR